jgi:hypothetical protein
MAYYESSFFRPHRGAEVIWAPLTAGRKDFDDDFIEEEWEFVADEDEEDEDDSDFEPLAKPHWFVEDDDDEDEEYDEEEEDFAWSDDDEDEDDWDDDEDDDPSYEETFDEDIDEE